MKKKNVRITTIILTVLLAVTLTSCGEKDFICGCAPAAYTKNHTKHGFLDRMLNCAMIATKN